MSITTISISELPEVIKNHYYKWVAITGVNNLDSYFENALAVSFPDRSYKHVCHSGLSISITDDTDYDWIFYYNGNFGTCFDEFEQLINNTYENI